MRGLEGNRKVGREADHFNVAMPIVEKRAYCGKQRRKVR